MNKTFTEEDIKLAMQFEKMFREYYVDSLERNVDGFELKAKHRDKTFFEARVWGECYDNLSTPEGYANTVVFLSGLFVEAFKNEYKVEEAA